MRNWKAIGITILLFLFSFYYTNKSVELIRNTDPIMKRIKENKKKFEIEAVDAKIIQNTIIPGIKGKVVDETKSFQLMKQYGSYNETLMTQKEVSPKISIKNHYDKYIVTGNPNQKRVSFLYRIERIEDYNRVMNYLELEHLNGTIFLSDKLLESVSLNPNQHYELLFDSNHKKESKDYFEKVTSKKALFCISNSEEKELFEFCKKNKLHTIIPTISLTNEPTRVIKENLRNGLIIEVNQTPQVRQELDYIIQYTKSKGYHIVTLEELLEE